MNSAVRINSILKDTDTAQSLMNRICKHRATFSCHEKRETEDLVTTGTIKGKQREKTLDGPKVT